ncbi:MAG TPA: glycoside hydrolase family 130 protein [Fimbriimonadaceae bacterium]|jgi:predicted GH43/DUF377 family glycosyl hydrolase
MILLLLAASLMQSKPIATISKPFGPFIRSQINPIFERNDKLTFQDPILGKPIKWQGGDVFNPASTVYKGKIYVLPRCEDTSGQGIGSRTSRIGLAESSDGIHFKMHSEPVVYPKHDDQEENEWPGGCEDPRVAATKEGLFVMAYTQWNRKLPRLAIATSRDLKHWTKLCPAFRSAYGGKFMDMATKSASIITEIQGGEQAIAKINGKYWMYWGEQAVYAATSDDLTSWTPVVDAGNNLVPIIKPRPGYFDSELTECGPPAVVTKEGILLFYNGKNAAGPNGDPNYNANSYSAGQLLLSKDNPLEPIGRLAQPFFTPTEPYEKSGQYKDGTVFMEGLSYFKHKWFLYYGCRFPGFGRCFRPYTLKSSSNEPYSRKIH